MTLLRAAAFCLCLASVAGAQGGPATIQIGVSVRPDTVTVGDPFVLQIRVRAPRGASIEFPAAPDSGQLVEALDPVSIASAADTTVTEQTATYRLAAWDTRAHLIVLRDVAVRTPGGIRRIGTGPISIVVQSVLPSDSAQRVPKAARPLFVFPTPWWWPWLPIAIAAALVLAFCWWLWRRRRRRPRRIENPFDVATREFARVEALQLPEAGEPGRYVVLVVEVVLGYLTATVMEARTSATSRELLVSVMGAAVVPHDRLMELLREADLVKYGRAPVAVERARELGREARAIVQSVHDAVVTQATRKAA